MNTKKICGFRKFDLIKYFGKEYIIKGRMTAGGYAILSDINGNTIKFEKTKRHSKTVKLNNCKKVFARKSTLTTITSVSDD